ncbi:glycosyltransferase family 2 protein [Salinigranum marinum]|uniref:glycosyltransferase family 2 protein n=1 Tax=Salinigranum marinum TaxID=1515595 RepID=UPI002989DE3D|nr:glycosyltransferase [Salinigranum marinum]
MISVVIPTKNAGKDFEETLKSIRNQDVSELEIIIIDSGSDDGTVELANEYANSVITISPNEFHHGKTRNRAANQSKGDVIVFTVQDALPTDNRWLTKLVNPIKNGVADVCYGNQIANIDSKPPDRFFYQYFYPEIPITITEKNTTNKPEFYIDNIFISDVNSAIARDVWNEFQFQDSVQMSEDKDFAYRVASAGYTIRYCPEAKVYHSHDYSLLELFTRRYKDGKAFAKFAPGESGGFVSEGIEYVVDEYSFLIHSGSIKWIPYCILYDLTYFVSFILGEKHGIIGEWISYLRCDS